MNTSTRREWVRIDTWDLVVQQTGGVGGEHIFRFEKQPSLTDFLDVCKLLPWTFVWSKTLLLDLEQKIIEWPVVKPGCKRGWVEDPGYGMELIIERSVVYRKVDR